jgi:predicted PurR-regulated permease PerM
MEPSTPPDHRPRPAELFRRGALVSLGAASTVIGLYALYTVRAILIRILIALFIAVSLDPAVRWLTRRGMRRGWAVTLIFLLAFLLFAAFLISVIPPLVSQGRNLADDLPDYLTRVQRQSSQYRELNDRYNISDQLQGLATNLPGRLGSGLLGFTGRVFGAVFNGLTVLVFTIYFMADMPRIRHGVVRLFPVERRPRAHRVVDLVVDKVGGYMIGNIIISLIAGVASFIAYQQLENYLIAPRVLKTTVELGAAAVLIAGLIGATVLGLVGALMAIPVAAAFNVLLNERLIAHETAAGVALPDAAEAAGAPPAADAASAPQAEVRGSGPPGRG